MNEKVKEFFRNGFRKQPRVRRFISRLNHLANSSGSLVADIKVTPEEKEFFTPKALYTGYSVEYLNAKCLTKEERACDLKRVFYRNLGYYLDLKNPVTFNQKIQLLKLYYRDPLMVRCVDKAEFKNYIKEQMGEEYVVPYYGAYANENDIDFDTLPDRFVLKSNVQSDAKHILLVKDKKKIDLDKTKTVLSTWLMKKNNLCSSYCNSYWDVTPKIVIEEYLEAKSGGIDDYKFYCYNGTCRHFLVCKDRGDETKYINYDMNFDCILPSPNSYKAEGKCENPDVIRKMIEIAEKLAKPFPFVRVDFYYVDGRMYIGELTFYPGGGYNTYLRKWDERFGSYLQLPEANF